MMYARENDFDAHVYANAAKFDVPPWVIKATIAKESSFRPEAFRPESGGRASRGLMQLLEATARELGLRGDVGNDATKHGGLYEPSLNIQLGTKYLAQQRKRYPLAGWDEIYAAYNAGSIRKVAGVLTNEAHVKGWRTNADYFNPAWRSSSPAGTTGPFHRAP